MRPQVVDRLTGLVVVVTDASYTKGAGPFLVTGEALDRLVAQHPDRVQEAFFGGDVTIRFGRLSWPHFGRWEFQSTSQQWTLGS